MWLSSTIVWSVDPYRWVTIQINTSPGRNFTEQRLPIARCIVECEKFCALSARWHEARLGCVVKKLKYRSACFMFEPIFRLLLKVAVKEAR